jgi:hypothetical protein
VPVKEVPQGPTIFILEYLQRFQWLIMIDIKLRVHTRNNVRWTTLKKASTKLDILEVLNGSDAEDLLCVLTDEVGVDCIDTDILHVISVELDGEMRKMLTDILGESMACSGVGRNQSNSRDIAEQVMGFEGL